MHSDYTNHLAGETSPYLLQHADNPVAWYPWGPPALDRARLENKPILLSVGYSACHWCHVMAHESFEDPETAELMNHLFVNIKVDREERPDIDRIYQNAHSLLTKRPGGWPLTVFLTPEDQIPFFAGTYFPDEPRHGMPSFREVLQKVAAYLTEHQHEIRAQNSSLIEALNYMHRPTAVEPLSAIPLDSARQVLERSFDATYGGFGDAPKFPHPTNIDRLLRHWAHSVRMSDSPDRRALHMAVYTLEKMAHGGIYDQIGGGFFRYSVDSQWLIPHFEKMLYDNGTLLALYAEAHAATGHPLFRRICRQTAAWVMREMQSPEGGYYSSLDADSEGGEGRYYLWTPEEVRNLFGRDTYALVTRRFGLDEPANFEGRWHLHVCHSTVRLGEEFSSPCDMVERNIASALDRLRTEREQRIRPGRDDKILTSWNGLMIRGMAIAGRHLGEDSWIASAEHALEFIRSTLLHNGRLLATCRDGRAHLNAYLDDYVYLLDAVLELLQVRWRSSDLEFAIELAEAVLMHFSDPAGGFYFTSHDHEQLIHRPKPSHDESTPAGNGIAAKVLNRLGHLLGEPRYLTAAEQTLKSVWKDIGSMPHGHASLLVALEESLFPFQSVIIRGPEPDLTDWHDIAARPYSPARFTLAIPDSATGLPGTLNYRSAADSTTAWICNGMTCDAPVNTQDKFEQTLTAV